MQIEGSVALVTGANRGIGAAFVRLLLERGASTVYAAARDPRSVQTEARVVPLALDVTDPGQVEAAVRAAGDVSLLVNNAGISTGTSLVTGDESAIRREMETNFYGPLRMTRAFAPVLRDHGGGAVVNVLSALSWFTVPGGGAYAASKAAAWMLTDSARLELAAQGTHVVGVHMGLVDTDMTAGFDAPKITPSALAGAALDAVESGAQEVLGDEWARFVKAGLALEPEERYGQILGALGAA
jgi:NAD(P)-dependent dehydrogenase (short-subunit alcohol dehydrogenase family)